MVFPKPHAQRDIVPRGSAAPSSLVVLRWANRGSTAPQPGYACITGMSTMLFFYPEFPRHLRHRKGSELCRRNHRISWSVSGALAACPWPRSGWARAQVGSLPSWAPAPRNRQIFRTTVSATAGRIRAPKFFRKKCDGSQLVRLPPLMGWQLSLAPTVLTRGLELCRFEWGQGLRTIPLRKVSFSTRHDA